jgi:hypothetical protein
MTKHAFENRQFGNVGNTRPEPLALGDTYVDMMTGCADQGFDQLSAAHKRPTVRLAADLLAIGAVLACVGGGPGVVAPRVGDFSAIQQVSIASKGKN